MLRERVDHPKGSTLEMIKEGLWPILSTLETQQKVEKPRSMQKKAFNSPNLLTLCWASLQSVFWVLTETMPPFSRDDFSTIPGPTGPSITFFDY